MPFHYFILLKSNGELLIGHATLFHVKSVCLTQFRRRVKGAHTIDALKVSKRFRSLPPYD